MSLQSMPKPIISEIITYVIKTIGISESLKYLWIFYTISGVSKQQTLPEYSCELFNRMYGDDYVFDLASAFIQNKCKKLKLKMKIESGIVCGIEKYGKINYFSSAKMFYIRLNSSQDFRSREYKQIMKNGKKNVDPGAIYELCDRIMESL